jgi:hypothetical protein
LRKTFCVASFVLLVGGELHADECTDWFQESRILPTDKQCILKCSSLQTDMGTFYCTSRCEELCRGQKTEKAPTRDSCKPNKAWEAKLKDGLPPDWPHTTEKPSPWTSDERKKMSEVFAKLPESFSPNGVDGIYRLKAARDIYSIGARATTLSNQIVFYDKAFDGSKELIRVFVHEFGHYLHEASLKDEFADYEKTMGWEDVDMRRPGKFMDYEAKESPQEDFAINFASYLLEPQMLRNIVPQAYTWMSQHLIKKFNLKECGK